MRASGSVGPSGQTTHQPQPIYGARPTPKQATSQSCFKCNAALDRKHPWPAAECRRGQSEAKAGADVKKVSVLPQAVPKPMPGAVPSAPCSRCGGTHKWTAATCYKPILSAQAQSRTPITAQVQSRASTGKQPQGKRTEAFSAETFAEIPMGKLPPFVETAAEDDDEETRDQLVLVNFTSQASKKLIHHAQCPAYWKSLVRICLEFGEMFGVRRERTRRLCHGPRMLWSYVRAR